MKTLQKLLFPALLIALLAFTGCGNDTSTDDHGHDHEAPATMDDHGHDHDASGGHDDHGESDHGEDERPTIAVTQWTDQMELFMEYPAMVADEPGRFIIHLTVLDGFQPVREGVVKLTFTGRDGHGHSFTVNELLREGIFAPTIELHDAGPQEFVLSYEGHGLRDSFTIDGFTVYSSASQIPHEGEAESGDEISFLKEQQWKIPFATADVETREIMWGTWAVAEVLPRSDGYAEIVAPVAGIVRTTGGAVAPGASVARGIHLATIEPPVGGEGWTSARLAYEHAKQDYERVQRLRERDAVSDHEYQQARTTYLTLQAGMESTGTENSSNSFTIRSPLSGRVMDWQVRSGQYVNAGDPLMAVVDPGRVWLRADVYEDEYALLGDLTGLWIKASGPSGPLAVAASQMTVISRGGTLNPRTRTVPVLMQVENADERLRIGERVPVELYSSDGTLYPSVPESAVFDDNGMAVVYVQPGGESFERRSVTAGPAYMGHVAILKGLQAGERVVTEGGYHVKLASTSAEIGHGHAH
ncbi:efflux RND transporter periplasmic adaptor subunit [bacterium]|nr:efflux RND transporter periplasmic adaptor subunit [bacterium]